MGAGPRGDGSPVTSRSAPAAGAPASRGSRTVRRAPPAPERDLSNRPAATAANPGTTPFHPRPGPRHASRTLRRLPPAPGRVANPARSDSREPRNHAVPPPARAETQVEPAGAEDERPRRSGRETNTGPLPHTTTSPVVRSGPRGRCPPPPFYTADPAVPDPRSSPVAPRPTARLPPRPPCGRQSHRPSPTGGTPRPATGPHCPVHPAAGAAPSRPTGPPRPGVTPDRHAPPAARPPCATPPPGPPDPRPTL